MNLYLEVQRIWRRGHRETKHVGLFQKIVYCPYCTHYLTFTAKNGNGKTYFSYRCLEANPGSKHCGNYIREEKLEVLHQILLRGCLL